MNRIGIAKFEKVSFSQWKKDMLSGDLKDVYSRFPEAALKTMYDAIKLPKRSTFSAAGYDFYLPMPMLDIPVDTSITIPTGIRCKIDEGWMLSIFPRSGHGFKYGLHLANSVGIIDADYYGGNNEGHIHIKLVNDSLLKKHIEFSQGDAFCQGIFIPFGITMDDDKDEKEVRKNGFGSTDRK